MTTSNDTPMPILLHSPELFAMEIPHAFTTRLGGFSSGPFETLNFGNPSELSSDWRDPSDRIAKNWSLVQREIACEARERVEVHQVHGAEVLVVRAGAEAHPGLAPGVSTRADAIVTDDPSRVLAVRVADCAPVLLASSDGRCVAAVHAGWKGVIAGVVPSTIRAMRSIGHEPMVAAIGPCIGANGFEIGPEVADQFQKRFGEASLVRPGEGDRSFLDLRAAIVLQLREMGVQSIDSVELCTLSRSDLFFSHRRATKEGAATGRMAALIGPIAR